MGLPTLNINFAAAAEQTARRISRGTVAIVVKETTSSLQRKLYKLASADDIPPGMTAANRAYISSAFVGNDYAPKTVIVATTTKTTPDYDAAFEMLAGENFDWLVAPPDCDGDTATLFATWNSTRRADGGISKLVLPNHAGDSEAVVNFTTTNIQSTLLPGDGSRTLCTTAEYCARIAGYIAGTELNKAVTYGVMSDVSDIPRLSKDAMNAAIDAGQLILMHDGVKVKIASGVTSLTTVEGNKFAQMKKIKVMATLDTMRHDLRLLVQDEYIGKLPNTYDNKCLLVTAISSYLRRLEAETILTDGSSVMIDVAAQRAYLIEHGVDVSEMSDDDIRRANTGAHIYIAAKVGILDAIENIDINISLDLGV